MAAESLSCASQDYPINRCLDWYICTFWIRATYSCLPVSFAFKYMISRRFCFTLTIKDHSKLIYRVHNFS